MKENSPTSKIKWIKVINYREAVKQLKIQFISPHIKPLMMHSQSASTLPPNHKKRRLSTTKTKQSGQKVSPPQQIAHKTSHKQNKQKQVYSPVDEQQYKVAVKRLYSLNDRNFLQAIDDCNFKEANNILNEIKQLIESINYGPNKKYLYNHLSVYHSNKAYVLQHLGDGVGSAKMMEQAISNFENAQGYILSRQQNLTHTSQWIKLNLQYFTTLSNVNKHLEAILSAQKCIQKISQSFRVLDAICAENLVYNDTPETIATETQSRVKTQKVNFKRIVIKQAQKILKEIDISSPHKLMTQNKQRFQQKLYLSVQQRKNMYFWKKNLQNNVKMAQKQLTQGKSSSSRNLLGLQKSSSFTEEFSLGELMNLGIRRMKNKLNVDQYYLISSPKIIQFVLFASVCYFTIATQTRFKQIDSDINQLKITEKYKRLNKDQIIFRCKVLHLKAIQLAAKHLPDTSSYFTHILNSFNKNYKSLLDQINQESESSMKSYDRSIEKYKKRIQAEQHGLNQEYGIRNVHSTNTLHLSSKTQKRQLAQKLDKLQKSTHQNTILSKNIKKRTLSKDKQTFSKRKISTNKKQK